MFMEGKTTVLVCSFDITCGSYFLSRLYFFSVTDVERSRAGRLMAYTALFKNLIFIKFCGFSIRTSILAGLNNL